MRRLAIDEELAALATLSSAQLRDRWRSLKGNPVPRVSPAMLRLALAWELQASVHGGLPRQVTQKLDQLAGAKTETRQVSPACA